MYAESGKIDKEIIWRIFENNQALNLPFPIKSLKFNRTSLISNMN